MAMHLGKTVAGFILSGLILMGAASSLSAQRTKKENESPESVAIGANSKEEIQAEFIEAMQEKLIGNINSAYSLFETFTKKHPEIAAGHFEFAEISVEKKIYSEVIPHYQRATELEPKNKWYWVRLAQIYDYMKMYTEAKETYKKLSVMYPREPEFILSAVSILEQQGQLMEAIGLLDRMETEIGITEEIGLEKYRLYMMQKKFPEALKELEKLQVQFPKETLYLGMAAEVYYAKGDKKKALESYQKILERDSGNTLIHLAIADYYQKEKDLGNAFSHLEKAFANRAVDIDKKVMILLSFLDQAKNSDAHRQEGEKLNKLLTEVHPMNPKSWSIAGDYALEQKNWRVALDDFEKVIELDPSKFIFFQQTGQLAIRLEEYQALEKMALKAEEMYPLQPEVYLYKGVSLSHNGKYADAEEALNYGKELVIENPLLSSDFLAALGTLFALKKDHQKSNEYFEKAIQISPNNFWAFQQYAAYTNSQKAVMMAEMAITLAPQYPETYATKAKILFQNKDLSAASQTIEQSIKNGGNQIKSTLLLYADIIEQNGNAAKAAQIRAEANAI